VNVGPLLFVLEYIKPLFQAISFVLLIVSGVIAARSARSTGVLLLCIACFVSALTVGVYFMTDVYLQWKVAFLPAAGRRVAFFMADLLYLIEVFLWPTAVVLVAREYRASGSPNDLTSR
jgi:hypothetical protein